MADWIEARGIFSLVTKNIISAKTREKLKLLYLHYHSANGHQTL